MKEPGEDKIKSWKRPARVATSASGKKSDSLLSKRRTCSVGVSETLEKRAKRNLKNEECTVNPLLAGPARQACRHQ